MANKLKFEQMNRCRHGLEHPAKNVVSPLRDAEEREVGEQTNLAGRKVDFAAILELQQLLAQVRTPRFFVLPETQRTVVVHQVSQLHSRLLRSETVHGYTGGSEYRQVTRLLETYGL